MVYLGFMKNKTNERHNKCYTGCHGDDISDQEGKNARQNSPLKGAKIFLY